VTRVTRGLDIVIDLASATAWGFGGYVLGSRLVSDQVGGVFGLAVFLSVLAGMLGGHLHDLRMDWLVAGTCPRCRSDVMYEHKHRRWDPPRNAWLAALTTWECRNCGFSHNEPWPCPQCPEAT
jgi:hypothetical protein